VIKRDMLPKTLRYIGGVDVAYTREKSIGCVAVLDFNSLALIEFQIAFCETKFPYIPTLLSFREIPPAILALKNLQHQPDVLLVDGQGIMHPYGLGFATHLGIVIKKPTIGVAKSPLCGEIGTFNEQNWAPITSNGKVIGAALKTKGRILYVSIGHMVSLKKAINIVKHCIQQGGIPLPIWMAHIKATEAKLTCRKG
jgi:deoxyribonuclease V